MIRTDSRLPDDLREQVSAALEPLRPEKVILFGSYAWGHPTDDSDIDLIVVLNSQSTPTTYREKMKNRLCVRRALDDLNRKYPLDVLVYTIPEWKAFQDIGSSFSKEIISRGIEV